MLDLKLCRAIMSRLESNLQELFCIALHCFVALVLYLSHADWFFLRFIHVEFLLHASRPQTRGLGGVRGVRPRGSPVSPARGFRSPESPDASVLHVSLAYLVEFRNVSCNPCIAGVFDTFLFRISMSLLRRNWLLITGRTQHKHALADEFPLPWAVSSTSYTT